MVVSSGAAFLSRKGAFAHAISLGKNVRTETSTLRFQSAHALLRDHKSVSRFTAVNRSSDIDVIIVGAGAAGLAAAWHLKKSGKSVLVLENEPALGGVMLNPTPLWRGVSAPLGSTYFYGYSGQRKSFLDDIGAKPIETGEDGLVLGSNDPVIDWWNPSKISSLPIPKMEREAFKTFRAVLMSTPVPPFPLSRASREMTSQYAGMTAADYVSSRASATLSELMDLYCRSVLGAPSTQVSAYALLNFYSLEFGDSFSIPCYTFPGGLGTIAQKAQTYLGSEHIASNALVMSVENKNVHVEVKYVDTQTGEGRSLTARSAIIATPKPIARHIVKNIPSAQFEAMGKVRYAPYITVALYCNAPLFKERAFDFWISDKERRFTDIIDATSSQDAVSGNVHRTSGGFVYMVSCPRPASDRMHMQDEAWLAAFAQQTAHAVDEHVPGAIDKIEEMHVFGWGHSMVVPEVGALSKLVPMINQSVGRIYFAHSDNDLAPAIENAMDAGFTAAERATRDR